MTRYLLVVTGASRGMGRAICQAFYEQAATPSRSIARCCLIARSTAGLEATRQSLLQQPLPIDQPSTITMHEIDLGAMETLEERWQQMLDGLMPTDYDHVVLINNAGTVGPIGPVLTESPLTTTLQDLQQTVDLNLTSLLWTTTAWGRWAIQHNLEATLVNISSLAALHPFPTMALYAAGKAARDMYYASLAQELAAISDSRIRLLSYAPGPLETDMVEEIRAAEALDPGLRPNFAKQLLDPLVSARVLVQLVWSDKTDAFGNGQHVDYYDVVEGQSEGVAQGEVSNNTTVK